MKNVLMLAFVLCTYSFANAQKENSNIGSEYKLDYKDPVSVVNGMIEASKTKDLKLNFLVFDPFIVGGEFYKYRMVYFTNDLKAIEELYDIRYSYVNGSTIISEDGMRATVPMWYKSSVREHQQEIHLINRYGNWYIAGF
jgi:hypothetical protein